jgi:hypothetical protein
MQNLQCLRDRASLESVLLLLLLLLLATSQSRFLLLSLQ